MNCWSERYFTIYFTRLNVSLQFDSVVKVSTSSDISNLYNPGPVMVSILILLSST